MKDFKPEQTFRTKKQAENEKEIFLAEENPRLDEDLPIAAIFPPSELIAIVKPKKTKSPYIETFLLFLCAVITVGADAFIFSSSLFGSMIAKLDNTFVTITAVLCMIAQIVPCVFWGLCIYKKAIRLGNFSVILTNDKIIACGKANDALCKTIRLEDVVDVTKKGSSVKVVGINDKIVVNLNEPDAFIELIKRLYEEL